MIIVPHLVTRSPSAPHLGSPTHEGETDAATEAGPDSGPAAVKLGADAANDRANRPMARWERPAVAILLVATAILYLWGLGASGWANSFYSAAAQAGSESWKAWFFGSSDAANSITVDKPPASLWVMGLSVRLFGLSSWSILVPQALMGVATVGLVYASVRRWFSTHAALLAGAVMATTPVAALMFRFNNPDAMLTLLMTGAAYCVLRTIEDGRRRWMIAAGVLIGFGFLTKQLQVLLIVPPLAIAHIIAAPLSLRKRIVDLLAGGVAMVVAAGWWLAIVELTPASMRPYVGGSQNNSIIELTLGYNGLGRLNGNETGSVGGGGPDGGGGNGGGMWGETGITRMFDGVMGGQTAWLIPAALVAVAVGLWLTRRYTRTDVTRAAVIVWGGWLVCTALVFSFMAGIFHEYYAVALAPAIAALVGIGAHLLWTRRADLGARVVMAATVLVTAWWSAILLGRAADWNEWLPPVVVGAGIGAALLIMAAPLLTRVLTIGAAAMACIACLGGPTAWTIQTVSTPQIGSIVIAGPAVAGARFGPGNGTGPDGVGGPPNGGVPNGGAPNGAGSAGGGNGVRPQQPPSAGNGTAGLPPLGGDGAGARPDGAAPVGGRGAGNVGGLLASDTPSEEVVATLLDGGDEFTWVAAAIGSNRASGFQLATELPVMPIGGFNGSDPSPTLEQFQEYVSNGDIHYFIAGGGFGQSMGGSSEATSIANWVTANFATITIDGVTLYDLTT